MLGNLFFRNRIDGVLKSFYGSTWKVAAATKIYPMYRFPDVYRAVEALEDDFDILKQVTSRHDEPLETLLSRPPHSFGIRTLNLATSTPRQIDYQKSEYFPDESFWVLERNADKARFIVRVRNLYQMANIEVAGRDNVELQEFLDHLSRLADRHSVYRNKVFELRFEPSGMDYGSDYQQSFQIHFLPRHEINEEEIILEDEVRTLVERNVIDFHRRREDLAKLGVPRKRGLLLYGPPGNGKTYTCKFLAGTLTDATTIFASGTALANIRSVFNVARQFQPSIVVLEDIDLVYSEREINPYAPQLGSLMDELDGAADADNLVVILTTNSIERVESAIKDRPGRVSQCIEVPNPGPHLRHKYLKSLLNGFNSKALQFDELVEMTEGASHAFIKEFVYRSIQIASLRTGSSEKDLALEAEDFRICRDEMTRQGGKAGRSIIGFRTEK